MEAGISMLCVVKKTIAEQCESSQPQKLERTIWQTSSQTLYRRQGHHRADQQLPNAAWDQKEGGFLRLRSPLGIRDARDCDAAERGGGSLPTKSQEDRKENRKTEIELFFNPEAPSMQQGLQLGYCIEIAALGPKKDVRHERAHSQHAFRKFEYFAWKHKKKDKGDAGQNDNNHSRQYSTSSPFVERCEAELARLHLGTDDRCYQVATDDEKYVDA